MKHIKVGDVHDLLDALPKERAVFNTSKKYTRAQAEKALSAGVDPEKFVDHKNYHVRNKAWKKMGKPLPEGADAQNAFLLTLQGTPAPKDPSALPGFYLLLRQRILKEVPVKPEVEAQTEAPVSE